MISTLVSFLTALYYVYTILISNTVPAATPFFFFCSCRRDQYVLLSCGRAPIVPGPATFTAPRTGLRMAATIASSASSILHELDARVEPMYVGHDRLGQVPGDLGPSLGPIAGW